MPLNQVLIVLSSHKVYCQKRHLEHVHQPGNHKPFLGGPIIDRAVWQLQGGIYSSNLITLGAF